VHRRIHLSRRYHTILRKIRHLRLNYTTLTLSTFKFYVLFTAYDLVHYSSSDLFLTILQCRGKGEEIRAALYYARVNFIDVRLNRETFYSLKTSGNALAFGQVPALLTSDGEHLLVQTNAIMRYITTLSDIGITLYPHNDPIEAAYIDALLDFEFDAFTGFSVSSYPGRMGFDFLED